MNLEITTPTAARDAAGFRRWLQASTATTAELLAWCDYGFVSARDAAEPHEQLLGALPLGGDRYPLTCRLAERLGALLDQHPDLALPGAGESEKLASLIDTALSIAAGLDCPERLAAPLHLVYSTLRTRGRSLPLLACASLTAALIRNQTDRSPLREMWLRMAGGEPDPLLDGTPEIGMEGLSMIPDGDAPDREALGLGLLAFAEICAPERPTRRQRFRAEVNRIKNLWALSSPYSYFVRLAHDYGWVKAGQGWAVDSLPELCVMDFGEVGSQKEQCWLVWHWFVRMLQPWEAVTVEREFCDGRVLLVRFSEDVSEKCKFVRSAIEELARISDEVSESEADAYVEQQMARVAQWAKRVQHDDVAEKVEKTRQQFQVQHGLVATCCL